MAGNLFEAPYDSSFGASQGPGDRSLATGGSLFGLNNHASLMGSIASGFDEPGTGGDDAFSCCLFSLGGPGRNNPSEGRTLQGYRGPRNRSASPRARPGHSCSTREDPCGSFKSQSSQGGPHGSSNNHDGRHDSTSTPPDPGLYTYPLTRQTLQTFDAMCKKAGLDTAGHDIALIHAEVFGNNNRHLGQAIMQAWIMMEVSKLREEVANVTVQVTNVTEQVTKVTEQLSTLTNVVEAMVLNPTPAPAAASPQLLDVLNPLALRLINSAQLSAYTAVKNKREGILPHSLVNIIKLTVAQEGPAFALRNLPAVHQEVEEASAAKRKSPHCGGRQTGAPYQVNGPKSGSKMWCRWCQR
ncbi:uncharacterized protein MELLADRAFT_85631 [Melampsora larici-populina 98AG31]|uniref:Uncharacterized protein n=1 Tax=Melampsora larici-populina (strain 98AG31 / pathotype 3-4-7) TaxID=747676 RepID=F4RJ88_MELLP|nr:uncharacterized protein MELLADRAFT_85631 [Melampsora larici-populina 98AG31]EGG07546.1 hypothetical protein MELLADRAFT_85631 [Melampsora larici-populina 98AG31]